jgi:uncharacterized membrane protein
MDGETIESNPDGAERSPLDLLVVLTVTLNTMFVVLQGVEGPSRVFLGVLFVFFAPGYAFVAVLFPSIARDDADADNPTQRFAPDRLTKTDGSVTTTERLVLSLGLSLFIVPLVGLLTNFVPTGVTQYNVIMGVGALTIGLLVVATVRRFRLPPGRRYGIHVGGTLRRIKTWIDSGDGALDRAVAIALVIGILLATSGVVYAIAVPTQGEQFTEFYLLTQDAETGEFVADDYPSNFTRGERATLYVGLTNQEHRTVDYTVVVQLHRVEVDGDSSTVLQRERLDTFDATLEHGESSRIEHEVRPTLVGNRIRLSYQLYRGDPPANPTVDNAYRHLHIWIDVPLS